MEIFLKDIWVTEIMVQILNLNITLTLQHEQHLTENIYILNVKYIRKRRGTHATLFGKNISCLKKNCKTILNINGAILAGCKSAIENIKKSSVASMR